MFKKGQLVRAYGQLMVIERVVISEILLKTVYGLSVPWLYGDAIQVMATDTNMKLIGNNFKFKGRSDGRII